LHLGFSRSLLDIKDAAFPNLTGIRTITLPTLILHGEYDSLIPSTEGKALFHNAATKDKRLLIIPGADHNDILWVGMERYLEAIREFVLP